MNEFTKTLTARAAAKLERKRLLELRAKLFAMIGEENTDPDPAEDERLVGKPSKPVGFVKALLAAKGRQSVSAQQHRRSILLGQSRSYGQIIAPWRSRMPLQLWGNPVCSPCPGGAMFPQFLSTQAVWQAPGAGGVCSHRGREPVLRRCLQDTLCTLLQRRQDDAGKLFDSYTQAISSRTLPIEDLCKSQTQHTTRKITGSPSNPAPDTARPPLN
jgi:hypothetical protein